MSEPVVDKLQSTAPVSNTPVVLRIMLAIVLLIPGIAGLAVFALVTATWVIQGFHFEVSDHALMPIVLFVGEFCILFSTVTVGIVLRYARWRKAPVASLVLAVTSFCTIAIGHVMMSDALGSVDASDIPGLLIISAVVVAAVSGLPFQHWWNAGLTGEQLRN